MASGRSLYLIIDIRYKQRFLDRSNKIEVEELRDEDNSRGHI